MVESYAVSPTIVYSFIAFIFLLLGLIVFFILNWNRTAKTDLAIMITDKGWKPVWTNLHNKKSFTFNKGVYMLDTEAERINKKGKLLFIFNEEYSAPLIPEGTPKWVSPVSLRNTINNDIYQRIAQGTEGIRDTLIFVGAICAIGAFALTAVIIAKLFEAI